MASEAEKTEAKRLWVAANVALQQGDLREYFKKAEALRQFMGEKGLKPDDLIPLLQKVNIVPSSFSRLEAIYGAASEYSRGAATEFESVVESSYVSVIGKVSAFFMDCKLGKNERATPDPEVSPSKREVTISIMEYIKDIADPNAMIKNTNILTLMAQKIAAVRYLKDDDPDALENIYAYKGSRNGLVQSDFAQFDSVSSGVDISVPYLGHNNLHEDWRRQSRNKDSFFVNGIALDEIAKSYNDFASEEDVLRFFDEVILQDFEDSEEQKKEALVYLTRAFYHGGLMNPVSSALTMELFKDENGNHHGAPELRDQKINIETTATGFRVQEFCSLGEVRLHDPENDLGLAHLADEEGVIRAEDGIGALVVAEGRVAIDFSKSRENPSLAVESNKIDIRHPTLRECLDKRNWLQIFVDCVKKALGWNQVVALSAADTEASLFKQQEMRSRLAAVLKSARQSKSEPMAVAVDDLASSNDMEQRLPTI